MQTPHKTLALILLLNLFAIHGAAAWQFTSQDVNALHHKAPDAKLSYGKDPLQVGELRLPSTPGPHPVVIMIHGGCWLPIFDMQNTAALADALRERGFATWNIEYRAVGTPGGGWPGTFQDVAASADYLRTIAKQYALDLDHVTAIGHSAGGHLALWLAGRHNIPTTSEIYTANPLHIQKVIALGAVTDLKTFRPLAKSGCGSDAVGGLLGNTPEKIAQHYRDASPPELLPLGVPQVLLFGKEDEAVPPSNGEAYVNTAKAKGDDIVMVVIEGAAHHEFTTPNSITWPVLLKALQR